MEVLNTKLLCVPTFVLPREANYGYVCYLCAVVS